MSNVRIKIRVTTKGDRRYIVYFRRGGTGCPEEYGGSFRTKREAQMRRDAIAGEIAALRDPKILLESFKSPTKPQLGLLALWNSWIDSRIDVGLSATALYGNSRDRWVPILSADRNPAMIDTDDVIAGVAELYDGGNKDGLAPSTISLYISHLRQVLDFAGVEPNPARSSRVKLPRGKRTKKEIPSNETWFAMRDKSPARSRLCHELQEACALRVSEATGIEWGDVDFPSGMVRVDLKTTAGRRWVPVPEPLLERIDGLLPLEDRYAARRVLGVASGIAYQDLQRASKFAGAPTYGTHALRHRRISLWLRHGIDAVQVAAWSGHANPSESTDTYGHAVLEPRGDEWRDFWLGIYNAVRVPPAAYLGHHEDDNG